MLDFVPEPQGYAVTYATHPTTYKHSPPKDRMAPTRLPRMDGMFMPTFFQTRDDAQREIDSVYPLPARKHYNQLEIVSYINGLKLAAAQYTWCFTNEDGTPHPDRQSLWKVIQDNARHIDPRIIRYLKQYAQWKHRHKEQLNA